MRLDGAEPETERLIAAEFIDEVVKVPGVVDVLDSAERGFKRAAMTRLASRLLGAAAGSQSSRSPPLARRGDDVARLLEFLGVSRKLRGEGAMNVPGLLQSPDRLTRQDGAPGRTASRSVAK